MESDHVYVMSTNYPYHVHNCFAHSKGGDKWISSINCKNDESTCFLKVILEFGNNEFDKLTSVLIDKVMLTT